MKSFLFILLIFLFLFPIVSFSAGIIAIPDAPRFGIDSKYLSVDSYRASIKVVENVAYIIIDEVFVNPYNRQIEGVFLFPLPQGASINNFTFTLNGKEIRGKIYEKDKARNIYEDIVRRLVDPALLEYIGKNVYKASIAPILPHKKVKVHLEFTYTLSRMGNTYYIVSPLSGLKYSKDPVGSVVVTGTIDTKIPIVDIYSPIYPIDKEISTYHATFSLEGNDEKPDKDLLIYFTQDIKDISGTLLTYKDEDKKDGYFMFLLSATKKREDVYIPKDIIVMLDRSGSMRGDKIKQAKEALNFIIDRLKPEDRISIIAFSSSIYNVGPIWISGGDKASINKAKEEIQDIDAQGGTNIYDALNSAFSLSTRKDTPSYIVFLTDGMPTVGNTDEKQIENLVKMKIEKKRLFVFGVGDDVNLEFLTRLFRYGRGQGEFIQSKDIETAISSFYSKIEDPMLTNISISYPDTFYDIYPKTPQDLFWGESITIFGRYKQVKDRIIIKLEGKSKEGKNTYTYEFNLTPNSTNSFIPYLWASRKIGYLLEEIRLNGEEKELVDEIISLSKKYGIVTPYTSYLVTEDNRPPMLPPAGAHYLLAPMSAKRKMVKYEQALQKSNTMEMASENKSLKIIAGKVFVKKDDYWIEEGYTNSVSVKVIKMFSKEYFDLLSEDKTLKNILALGNVIFKYNGVWIKIEQ